MTQLPTKVVLVTASSRGIGATIAHSAAPAGASVIVNYAGGHAAAEAVVTTITAVGDQALAVQADEK